MTTTTVTKAQAEGVLAAVKDRYSTWIEAGFDGPKLIMDFDWLGDGARPAIVWEEGPFEWALADPGGDIDEEMSSLVGEPVEVKAMKLPEGVWTEPITGWALAIYPAD